jgi:hypothetical protein
MVTEYVADDWDNPPQLTAAAIFDFHRLVAGLTKEYPYLSAEWDEELVGHGFHIVRLRGPAQEGPTLCLILSGPGRVWVGRVSPREPGWKSGDFDMNDPEQVADLADLIYDLARDHFSIGDQETNEN